MRETGLGSCGFCSSEQQARLRFACGQTAEPCPHPFLPHPGRDLPEEYLLKVEERGTRDKQMARVLSSHVTRSSIGQKLLEWPLSFF